MSQRINVSDFALAATLECGQAFRWQRADDGWYIGVVGREVWRLRQCGPVLEIAEPTPNPSEEGNSGLPSAGGAGGGLPIVHYLALDVSLPDIIATFPDDLVLQP